MKYRSGLPVPCCHGTPFTFKLHLTSRRSALSPPAPPLAHEPHLRRRRRPSETAPRPRRVTLAGTLAGRAGWAEDSGLGSSRLGLAPCRAPFGGGARDIEWPRARRCSLSLSVSLSPPPSGVCMAVSPRLASRLVAWPLALSCHAMWSGPFARGCFFLSCAARLKRASTSE